MDDRRYKCSEVINYGKELGFTKDQLDAAAILYAILGKLDFIEEAAVSF